MSVSFKTESLQRHKELSDKIKDNLTTEGSLIKEKTPHGSYYDNLPEGHTVATVEELSKYNAKFVTASHLAVGEVAATIMLADKKVDKVEASVGFFGKDDAIEMTVDRSRTYQNHLATDDKDKEVVKSLFVKSSVSIQSHRGYGLKSVRDSMSEEFKNMFSK